MTAVVADTHTIIWYLRETARLSPAAMIDLDAALANRKKEIAAYLEKKYPQYHPQSLTL
ncbi:hypothetical protein [Argonema antarcticum]|uniref:hypothetical protein n=1 Tax=Argonema antarcticum TaxID=2942763 RepID=UPI002011B072|nr:hypothetical protein [Argonema antarcticum]MCL1474024.1 hypothetical protein [Argonema antarcticum A004/B2]